MNDKLILFGLIGWLAAQAGKLWQGALTFTLNLFSATLVATSDEAFYVTLLQMVEKKMPKYKNKRLTNGVFTYGPGFGWFFYKGKLVLVNIAERITENGPVVKSLYLRVVFANNSFFEEIFSDFKKAAPTLKVYTQSYSSWNSRSVQKREKDSVYLCKEGEALLEDTADFCRQRDWYVSRGVPYRRGYLLHGKPGTGKTSLVKAVASELDAPLYIFNLSAIEETMLDNLMSNMAGSGPKVLLFEDIDCQNIQKLRAEPSVGSPKPMPAKISLSTFLNLLDGVNTPEGSLIFLTTNDKSGIDEAVFRPGRIDVSLEFKEITEGQRAKMRSVFGVTDLTIGQECRTTAELQGVFMKYAKPEKGLDGASPPRMMGFSARGGSLTPDEIFTAQ